MYVYEYGVGVYSGCLHLAPPSRRASPCDVSVSEASAEMNCMCAINAIYDLAEFKIRLLYTLFVYCLIALYCYGLGKKYTITYIVCTCS